MAAHCHVGWEVVLFTLAHSSISSKVMSHAVGGDADCMAHSSISGKVRVDFESLVVIGV